MSIQFETRPVRRPRGPDRALILAVALAAFVGLAVLKPWQSEAVPAVVHAPVPVPTRPLVAAAVAASPSPAPRSDRDLVSPIARTWPLLRGRLSDRSSLGFRSITEPDQSPSPGGGAGRDASVTTLVEGTLVEHWDAVAGGDAAALAGTAPGALPATRLARASRRQPVLAVGVTTGPATTPLDVRFWRVTATGSRSLTTSDLGAAARDLMYLTPAEDRPATSWPVGRYLAELLLDDRIIALPFEITAGPQPADPGPRAISFTPGPATIRAALANRGRGGFSIDVVGRATVVPVLAGDPLDAHGAWLALTRSPSGWPPPVVRLADPAPAVLGVTLPANSVLQSASLWVVAPETTPMAADRFVAREFVAFARPGRDTWPAGTYRITARYWDAAYRLREASWHLDAGSRRPILAP